MVYSISATTRKPRPHEVNGIHYFFLSKSEFEVRIRNNEFAEWQEVFGNFYGTPKSFIDTTIKLGSHIVMDIDVYGKKKFDAVYPKASGILIMPPSLDELNKRLSSRSTETPQALQIRLNAAHKEIEFAQEFGSYQYTLINDKLEAAQVHILSMVDAITAG